MFENFLVIIPTYNESENINYTYERIKENVKKITENAYKDLIK